MTYEFFPDGFQPASAYRAQLFCLREFQNFIAGRNSFEQLFVGAPCFSLMFWDCDSGAFFCLLWISRLFRFIKQTQLTFDVFAFFTGSAEKLFRQVIDLFHQVFVILTQIFHSFLQGTVEFCLCCEQCIQLGYGILVFQEFDLCRAACHHPCLLCLLVLF